MDTKKAIEARRSIRKFLPIELNKKDLLELVEYGKLYTSAMNVQPVRFAIVSEKDGRDKVFESLRWAGYVKGYTIEENERPMAYILILEPENKSIFYEFEAGAAATNVMLLAEEKGIQSCCLMLADPDLVNAAFDFKGYKAMYAIALGKAAIQSKSVRWEGNQAYYTEENGNFCVPKRDTEEILVYSDIKLD